MVDLIDSIGLERLNNGAHYAYHANTLAQVKANATINEHCAKVLMPYDAAFLVEDEALKTSRKSFLTDEIKKNDDLRDTLYISYKQMVAKMLGIAIPEMAEAAKVLNQHIKDYHINTRAQLDKETGLLKNFIADLEDKYAEQVEALSLTSVVTQLKTANDKVNELIQQRADEYAARTVGAMKQARLKVDEAYRNLMLVINAYMLMEDDNEDYIAFAKHQNEEIKRIKQQVLGQKPNTKPDEGGDEPTPEPEPVTPEITAVYQKEGGDPENPNRIERGKQTGVNYKGFTLKGQDGTLEHVIGLVNDQDYIEWIKPETISNVTETSCEFTMVPDLTEGQYKVRIETYDGGSPLVVEYPEPITLW